MNAAFQQAIINLQRQVAEEKSLPADEKEYRSGAARIKLVQEGDIVTSSIILPQRKV